MSARHVLIGMVPEPSSLNAGLVLADALRAHGHRATFVGTGKAEYQQHITKHGHEYVSLGGDTTALEIGMQSSSLPRLWRVYSEIQQGLERALLAYCAEHQGVFDLMFLDVNATFPGITLPARLGLPAIVFLPNYASRFSVRYPPVFSTQAPAVDGRVGLGGRVRHLVEWAKARRMRQWWPLSNLLQTVMSYLLLGRSTRRVASDRGVRFCYGEWGARPALPELVIGHKVVDWPALAGREDRCYLGSMRLPRQEDDPGWRQGIDFERPLVYCGLSTLYTKFGALHPGDAPTPNRQTRRARAFIDALLAAFAQRPSWQLVLACGPFASHLDAIPPNVRVFRHVPQPEVLLHAAVAVTQGGAGTVRECVSLGVPMLVVPFWADHFGNAARVVAHRLGLTAPLEGLTPETLVGSIEQLLGDRDLKEAAVDRARRLPTPQDDWVELQRFVERHTQVAL